MKSVSHFRILKPDYRQASFSNSQILFAIFCWALLLLRFGYCFGSDDQIELLPYTLFLHNPSLYPRDLFIHGLHAAVPNERTFAACLLSPFINHLEIVCLVLHFISTVILVMGLENLANRFIKSKMLVRLCILVSLIPFANVTLGSVVTYSEMFQASFLGAAIALWGIIAFIDRRFILCSAILSVATFVHLLEGLDVMIVLSIIFCLQVFYFKTEKAKTFILFTCIYLFTAGVYLWFNLQSKQILSAAISEKEYYNILFRFRLAHHYMISSFPIAKTILFFILSIIAVAFFYKKSKSLFCISVVGVLGMLVYAFVAEKFDTVFLASFQFFKMAQWIKFFGLIAGFAILESFLPFKLFADDGSIAWKNLIAPIVVALFISLPVVAAQTRNKNVYQIGDRKNDYSEVQICEAIQKKVSNAAVFVQPLMFTELKYYSQRSSFVDYKAAPRNGTGMKEWYRRLNMVYGLNANGNKKGFEVIAEADSFYSHLPVEKILELKQNGVTHVLTKKEFPLSSGTLILQNNTYAVYQL